MKTSGLIGAKLDYWVAKAEGCKIIDYVLEDGIWYARDCGVPVFYSRDWVEGGPIIERERISVVFDVDEWVAGMNASIGPGGDLEWNFLATGETLLMAAMRAYVANKFGDDVPE